MPPRDKKYYSLLLCAVALWCLLLVSPPFLGSGAVTRFLSPVCHQLDSRSFHIFGAALGVCERCTGIYFGFLAGIIAVPFVRRIRTERVRLLWFLAALPMLLDVGAEFAGVWAGSPVSRVITGSVFGLSAAFILVPVYLEACRGLFQRQLTSPIAYSTSEGVAP